MRNDAAEKSESLPAAGMQEGGEIWGNRLKESSGAGETGASNSANIAI